MAVEETTVGRKLLPKGGVDALRQVGLFAACYMAYQMVRGLADGSEATAFWNANQVINLENSLHVFVEPSVQAWSRGNDIVIGFADWMYVNSHYVITFSTLIFIYMRRNASFYFVRNMFLAAMTFALVGYAAYPTAPPRLMPEWGFSDTIALTTGSHVDNQKISALINLYAAVPSMHVCFSLMIGGSMFALTNRKWTGRLWLLYPLLVTWVVVATGNHYLFDAVLGAFTAGIAWLLANQLGKRRDGWKFRPDADARTPLASEVPA
ncbi:MAG: hypothetical protein F2799_04220 [Actinobacteria bacterium]|uniref:Unannotated protein n=1 Tax=freshwater metagenome TaxID=449393 RepID=A0A6J7DWS2_9ZZZZ|nr:hypothetical protein [Actinomycetota bacterium]